VISWSELVISRRGNVVIPSGLPISPRDKLVKHLSSDVALLFVMQALAAGKLVRTAAEVEAICNDMQRWALLGGLGGKMKRAPRVMLVVRKLTTSYSYQTSNMHARLRWW
jgi:hypothetical protein